VLTPKIIETVGSSMAIGGIGRGCSAEAMVSAVRTHLTEAPGSTLRRIHIVLFQDETLRAFMGALGLPGARRVG